MTVSGFEWTSPPDQAFPALLRWQQEAIYKGIVGLALYFAPQTEAWMKANAVWTDRTGNARQALYTDLETVMGEMVTITLNHGVDYGYFLEVSNQGRYSVLLPALDYWTPKIWDAVKQLLS